MTTLASLTAGFAGFACLALAMPRHWGQALAGGDPGRAGPVLRWAGLLLLAISLRASLVRVPVPGIAIVDWLGFLTLAGLAVALTLTHAPRRLPVLAAVACLTAGAASLV